MGAVDRYAQALADAVDAALPGWVMRSVERVLRAQDRVLDGDVAAAAADAGRRAAAEVGGAVRRLVAADVDAQTTTPLSLLRGAVRYPTEVLRAAGATPVRRDDFAVRNFPDDDYDLSPASFADLDSSVQDPGIAWGAAKAHIILRRRRSTRPG